MCRGLFRVFCRFSLYSYLCVMDSDIQKLLADIAMLVNVTEDMRAILTKLVELAKDGSTEAVKELREIIQQAKEEQLRKDLFGV